MRRSKILHSSDSAVTKLRSVAARFFVAIALGVTSFAAIGFSKSGAAFAVTDYDLPDTMPMRHP